MASILLVDDSASMRQMVSFTLKEAGHNVNEAEDGAEALQFAKGNTVNLVITDINMPNMDGIEFIWEARKLPQMVFTPICMLTTETEQSKLETGESVSTEAWITKPIQPAHVLNIVMEIVPP